MATTMARSMILLPHPTPLNRSPATTAATAKAMTTVLCPPLKITAGPSSSSQRGRALVASVATDNASGGTSPAAPPPGNADPKNAGSNQPTVVNTSGLSIQIPGLPSSWSPWLIGAAALFSVPLYRRIKRVEEVIEQAEEAVDTAIHAIDHAAEEVGHVAADLAKTTGNVKIKEVALKVEAIAEKIEKDAELADEILHKVEHMTEEVEELLEPLIEKAESQEKEGKHKNHNHNHNRSINNSEADKSDTE